MIDLTFEQKQDIGLKYVLDMLEPACPYGAKLLKKPRFYKPSEKAELERELNNVDIMLAALKKEPDKFNAVRHTLSALKDVTGSIENCAAGSLTEVELFELTAFLLRLKELIPQAEALTGYDEMTGVRFEPIDEPLSALNPSGSGRLSFYIEDTRTPELQRLRREKRELEKALSAAGAAGTAGVMNVAGVMGVADTADAPDAANKDELTAKRLAVTSAEERELLSIYAAMSDSLRPMLPILEKNAKAAGRLDAAMTKALPARRFGATKPEIGGDTLTLEDAVNPEIAEALSEDGRKFTPITCELLRGVTILTGANMGGKSVAIKTITLNAALALMGFFVFCRNAKIPVFDNVELINRDFSSAAGGLSSFGGEIMRFNEAAGRLREGGLSLIAMDEFARGTNSGEGAAIARGAVKYLNGKNAVTILATHYDGASEFASRRYQVRGLDSYREKLKGKKPSGKGIGFIADNMDYGLIRVDKDAECPRDALLICRLLGMDEEILEGIM